MSKVNTSPASAEPIFSFLAAAKDAAPVETPPPAAPDQADFRLVIEEDESTGAFIYKTMDRRTGEIIQQFPREQVLRLREAEQYSAGQLVNARA